MVMIKANIHEIKAKLSKYIEMAEAGETVVICRRNIPVAEIHAVAEKKKRTPILGAARGQVRILPSFFEPMSEEELALWEGGSDDFFLTTPETPGDKEDR